MGKITERGENAITGRISPLRREHKETIWTKSQTHLSEEASKTSPLKDSRG